MPWDPWGCPDFPRYKSLAPGDHSWNTKVANREVMSRRESTKGAERDAAEKAAALKNVNKSLGVTFLGRSAADLDLSLLKMVPLLHEEDRCSVEVVRGCMQGVFRYIATRSLFDGEEGQDAYRKFASNLVNMSNNLLSLDDVNLLFAGLYNIVQKAVMSKLDSGKIVEQLKLANVPEKVAEDLGNALVKSRLPLEKVVMERRVGFPKMQSFRWRVDVAISSGSLSRVMMPTMLFQMTLSNGRIWTFEASVQQFNQLRYGVAKTLQDMAALERHPVMRMENEDEQKRLLEMMQGGDRGRGGKK